LVARPGKRGGEVRWRSAPEKKDRGLADGQEN
jgi:hypothetical protein